MVWIAGAQGHLAPSLVALFDEADDRWPFRSRVSDGSLGDSAHAARSSDHNPKAPNPPGWVDAGDITEDFEHGPDLPALWNHLIGTRDPRVKYLIYEGRIVKSYVDSAGHPAWVPQPYTGLNAHKQHMHISVLPEGRTDTSPWFPQGQEDDMGAYEQQQLDSIGAKLDSIGAKVDQALGNLFDADDRAQLDNVRADVTQAITEIRDLSRAIGALAAGDVAAAQEIVDEIGRRLNKKP